MKSRAPKKSHRFSMSFSDGEHLLLATMVREMASQSGNEVAQGLADRLEKQRHVALVGGAGGEA